MIEKDAREDLGCHNVRTKDLILTLEEFRPYDCHRVDSDSGIWPREDWLQQKGRSSMCRNRKKKIQSRRK